MSQPKAAVQDSDLDTSTGDRLTYRTIWNRTCIVLITTSMFVVLVLSACAPPDNVSIETHRTDSTDAQKPQLISAQFESIAQDAVGRNLIEGIQFALVEGGQTLSTQAFGLADREQRVAMTVDTPINVASISKSLTAWGVLAFLEENNLELDASARELFTESKLFDEIFSDVDVSIRMLLSHTSGLSGASVPVTPATESIPGLNDILLGRSSVSRARLRGAPDNGYLYSGAGYLVLQRIIEDQTEQSFANFVADKVLRPSQMIDSTFALTQEMLSDVAVYYRGDGRRRDPYHLPGAAGGLYSTASDMARFLTLYSDHGRGIRETIISDERYMALLHPAVVAIEDDSRVSDIQYSLGHYTYVTPEGAKIVFHSGGNPGLRAIFVVCPDRDVGFFAVANNDKGSEVLEDMMHAWGQYYGLTMHQYR